MHYGLRRLIGAAFRHGRAGRLGFAAILLVAFGVANACTSEHQPALSKHECTTNRFRACDGGSCRGVQQCVDPGFWSECDCVVGDASYADNGSDAVDAPEEQASDAGDADLDVKSD